MARGRALVFIVGLMTAAAACGAGPQASPSSDSTITWLADSITEGPNDPRQPLIDAFENAHPSIKVVLMNGPNNTDTLRDTLRRVIPSGPDAPDVYLGDVIWPAAFGRDGLALPLSDHLPRDYWSRFPGALVRGATYRGKTYAAPFFTDQGLLYYRKDLLAQEHLAVPETWEQLVAEASELQAKGLVKDGFLWQGASYEGLTCVWTELMADAGGQALDSAGTRSTIDSAQSLKALRFLRGLVTSQVTPAAVTTFIEQQVIDRFDAGQAGFARGWPNMYVDARAAGVIDEVGVAPLPAFAGGPSPGASTAGGWALSINPHTAHLQAALTFVNWMTDVEAQGIMASEYQEIPANTHVRSDPTIAARNPVLAVVGHMTVTSRPADTPAYPMVSQAIYTNVYHAITGAVTPEKALRTAGQQIDRALSGNAG